MTASKKPRLDSSNWTHGGVNIFQALGFNTPQGFNYPKLTTSLAQVPNVTGDTAGAAHNALVSAGLVPIAPPGQMPGDSVTGTDPAGGSAVPAGSDVTINASPQGKQGQTPKNLQTSSTSGGGNLSAVEASNKSLGQKIASSYGWGSGSQWSALNQIVMLESGWNNQATNPSSGAYGIGQALGHGSGPTTKGNVTNQYGGFGVSDQIAQDANSGSAAAQITWMLQYIKQKFGNPVNALAFHLKNGYY